jgi:hypothetical protein
MFYVLGPVDTEMNKADKNCYLSIADILVEGKWFGQGTDKKQDK